MLLQLAFRNLRRNLRRTLITLRRLVLEWWYSYCQYSRSGQYDDMIDSSVSQLAGHVVVQHPDYQQGARDGTRRQRAGCDCDCTRQALPEAIVTSRIRLGGILASSSSPTVINLTAVNPQSEDVVSDLPDKLVEGTWVRDDAKSIVIGQNMAELLQADLGDRLVFTTSVDGEMNSHLYRLSGVFRTGAEEVDAFMGYVSLSSVADILGQENISNQVAVHLESAGETAGALSTVQRVVGDTTSELAVQPWEESSTRRHCDDSG